MTKQRLLTYAEVLNNLSEKPVLLLGNGFSMAYDSKRFSFTSLLETARKTNLIKSDSNLSKLFEAFNTTDFEAIIKVLDNYIKTANVYNPEIDLEYLKEEIGNLKKYLVDTITNNHPDKITALKESEINSCITFIEPYDRIYTLNYDLLLYWVSVKILFSENQKDSSFNPKDGFQHSEEFPDFVEFANEGSSNLRLLYLHGGLHLYDAGYKILKLTYSQTNRPLKEQILENLDQEIYPIFISEGTSNQKLEKIIHNSYLNTCYRKFKEINKDLVIFGTALKKNDKHIADAIINSNAKNIYIGVSNIDKISEWVVFDSRIKEWNESNTNNSKSRRSNKTLYFYDYKTVDVWGRNQLDFQALPSDE